VSRASRARKIATVAAYGGGGLGAIGALGGAALFGVLLGESKLARRRIPVAEAAPPVSHDTTWAAAGVRVSRTPIRIAMLGDSTAAGYGVHRDRDTPAAQLAISISDEARRPVHVTNVAAVGADGIASPSSSFVAASGSRRSSQSERGVEHVRLPSEASANAEASGHLETIAPSRFLCSPRRRAAGCRGLCPRVVSASLSGWAPGPTVGVGPGQQRTPAHTRPLIPTWSTASRRYRPRRSLRHRACMSFRS